MRHKIFAFCLSLLIICSLTVTAQATLDMQLVIDGADLFTDQERQILEAQATELQQQYGMDVVILTVDSLDGISAQDYADDYYDDNGYAEDGILFLLAMSEREWYISTCGDGIYAFTDYGIQTLGELLLPYLGDGNYYLAFQVYSNALPQYLDAFEEGTPVDGYADYSGDYCHGVQEEVVYYEENTIPIIFSSSLCFGVIAGLITIIVMRLSMNTRRRKTNAQDYLVPGSYDLHTKEDTFLYSKTSKVSKSSGSSRYSIII